MSDSPFGSWDGVAAHPLFDGVSLHAVGGEQVLLCRVSYEPGTTVARHSHDATEQVMLVLSGEVELTVADETRVLGAGGLAVINRGIAHERFLPAGPFAVLPMTGDAKHGHRSSIVWTERTRDAERLVALPDDEFHAELEQRFGLHLGELKIAGSRRAYPLGLYNARSFIGDRLALIGDAAHVIHPIAGQGLNMGLRDVAALAESVADAARLGLDIGSPQVLERYQRWRRFDTMTMSVATDGLNRLFSNHSDALRLVRDIGLGLVERMPALKRTFIREAAGVTGEVPKLMKGEMV